MTNTTDRAAVLTQCFRGPKPPIVTLCGSTRFSDAFRTEKLRLTLEGAIVLDIGCNTKSDDDLRGIVDIDAAKRRLDVLHFRKIDISDWILVLNVDGYIGESTRGEIAYASRYGVPVVYLEPLPGQELA